MKAYVQIIQSKEAEIGCDVLTHQKVTFPSFLPFSFDLMADEVMFGGCVQWSGADYADSLLKTITGGISSTAAMGAGVTEDQFGSHK